MTSYVDISIRALGYLFSFELMKKTENLMNRIHGSGEQLGQKLGPRYGSTLIGTLIIISIEVTD